MTISCTDNASDYPGRSADFLNRQFDHMLTAWAAAPATPGAMFASIRAGTTTPEQFSDWLRAREDAA
jgi:hypothetical protein